MRIAKTLPLSLILAGMATPALAAEPGDTYLGGGFGMVTYEEQGLPEAEPSALVGRLGYHITSNIAIEGRLGFGISDDDINFAGVPVAVEVDQLVGAYAVGYLPLAEAFSLYGLAGFSYGEGSASAAGYSLDDDDTDFSYGVGATFDVTQNVAGYIEWAQYFDESSYEVTGITLGASYHF